jgi:Na+/H+ antiporter NhaD/arsenite permease-like protein
MNDVELLGSVIFFLAILHTFSVKRFQTLARRYPEGSVLENLFHLLGEVEVVFGLWAAVFLAGWCWNQGASSAIEYLETRDFKEPLFVFVILVLCSTRPLLNFASALLEAIASRLPLERTIAFFLTALTVGPLLGSLITEPAAMTMTALLLLERIFLKTSSQPLKYATLGLLFVNVSIGGTLTPFAAPPVLMVASRWQWDLGFMLQHFGWKAAIAIAVSTLVVTFRFRKELAQIGKDSAARNVAPKERLPVWVVALHLMFLILVVITAHHLVVFLGIFMFFLGVVQVTQEYQTPLRLREGLLVAFFLGGLVVLGGVQRWWLEPLLMGLSSQALFLGATALTAVTDNAALTYLGAQVPGLTEVSKLALVAGAVTGGGLTVIANAPNPAGYGILNGAFGDEGISPRKLLLAALGPTIVALLLNWPGLF